jgi:hypothetical protein
MSLTKILTRKDADAEEQLTEVATVVGAARKAYGNEDAEIAAPMVNTVHGQMAFSHLEPAAKIALLRDQVAMIKASAVEQAAQQAGTNMNKAIEQLLATNPYFTNVEPGVKFDYI